MNINTNIVVFSLVAVPSVSLIGTTILVADGVLRTTTGCTGPLFSLTLYVL